MISWLRVVGLVKIGLAEFLAVSMLATTFGALAVARGARGCPPQGKHLDGSFYLGIVIGLLALAWLLFRMIRPVEVEDTYTPSLKLGPVAVPNPTIAPMRYKFCSTHPSYVLIDLLLVFGAWMVLDGTPATTGCTLLYQWGISRAALPVALLFPLVRLACWYLLGLRLSEQAQVGAWKPVLLVFAVLLAPLALWGHLALKERRVRAATPLVDATTLAGGLKAHAELIGPIVRVKGARLLDSAARCECRGASKDDCGRAEMLLDLGAGGEVVVQARASEVMFLLEKSEGKKGQPDEAFGRLSPLPNPTKKHCGAKLFGPPPPAGRALLEIEYP